MTATLLIVDDEPMIRRTLRYQFEQLDWEVAEAATGAAALDAAASTEPDVVLLDVRLPDADGLDVLVKLREMVPCAVVIVMTAHGDVEMAVEAVRSRGAFWFFQKPVDTNMLQLQVQKAHEHARALKRERVASDRGDVLGGAGLGQSAAMREVDRLVNVLAGSGDTTVLLLGESGTGKGVVAELIHRRSARRDAPFQEINCAGLSETFLESELFGAERGAYTDAKTLKRGLLELADGGTVFLDEIGDLAPALQPKLLKVLEARRFRRLGGVKDLEVNVRLVAATNRDLKAMASDGRFREDLYYRLNVMALRLPPLRERESDALILAARFIEQFNRAMGRTVAGLAPDAEAALLQYAWPGNVRELRNVIERAMILGQGELITTAELPSDLTGGEPQSVPGGDTRASLAARPAAAVANGASGSLPSLVDVERAHIERVLLALDNNRSRAAQALGISRSTLIDKIKRYGLDSADAGQT